MTSESTKTNTIRTIKANIDHNKQLFAKIYKNDYKTETTFRF